MQYLQHNPWHQTDHNIRSLVKENIHTKSDVSENCFIVNNFVNSTLRDESEIILILIVLVASLH